MKHPVKSIIFNHTSFISKSPLETSLSSQVPNLFFSQISKLLILQKIKFHSLKILQRNINDKIFLSFMFAVLTHAKITTHKWQHIEWHTRRSKRVNKIFYQDSFSPFFMFTFFAFLLHHKNILQFIIQPGGAKEFCCQVCRASNNFAALNIKCDFVFCDNNGRKIEEKRERY